MIFAPVSSRVQVDVDARTPHRCCYLAHLIAALDRRHGAGGAACGGPGEVPAPADGRPGPEAVRGRD